jgi:hypothetical protein
MPNCPRCGKAFTHPRNKYCSVRCGKAAGATAAWGLHFWSDAEEEVVERLAETMPLAELTRHYNTFYAKPKGWPERGREAIRLRLKRLGISRKCSLDNFTLYELARQLDCSRDRVESWIQRYGLPCRKVSRNQLAIRRTDLIRFAQAHPHRLAGIDPERLLWLLEDAELVERISRLSVSLQGLPRSVRRLDTGEVYGSCHQADRAHFLSRGSVGRAARTGTRAAGFQWEYLEGAG